MNLILLRLVTLRMKVVVVLGRRFFLLPREILSCRQSKKGCGAWNTAIRSPFLLWNIQRKEGTVLLRRNYSVSKASPCKGNIKRYGREDHIPCTVDTTISFGWNHRVNMELDLQSLLGLYVYSCTHWLRPSYPPSPFGLIYKDATQGGYKEMSSFLAE